MTIPDELIEGEAGLVSPATGRPAHQARRGDPPAPARGGRGRVRRAGLPRGVDRQDHRARRHRPRHLLPVLRQQAVDLRGARDRPQPPRAPLDVGGDGGGILAPRGRARGVRPASSASPPSTRPCTASCARPSSSRPRRCACTTRASSRATRPGSAPRRTAGDVDRALDPEVTAWALMGMGELIGMRFLLWERDADRQAALGARPGGVRRHDAVHRQRAGAASAAADAAPTQGRDPNDRAEPRGQARARHRRRERHRTRVRARVRGARRARDRRRPPRLPRPSRSPIRGRRRPLARRPRRHRGARRSLARCRHPGQQRRHPAGEPDRRVRPRGRSA